MSIAARTASSIADSVAYGEQSAFEAKAAGVRELITRALMTWAGSLMLDGQSYEALRLISEAEEAADSEHLSAQVRFQRAAILLRLGDLQTAEAEYTTVLPILSQFGDREFQGMALSNRALTRRFAGKLTAARADLLRARDLYEEDGVSLEVAYTDHNLGWLALDAGDIPEALRLFDISEASLAGVLDSISEVQTSRCEALLSAGLFREAMELALKLAADMGRSGLRVDEAEAWLLAAQAALLAERPKDAMGLAVKASGMFSAQGRSGWAALARLTSLQVQDDAGINTRRLLGEAKAVARELAAEGQVAATCRARLLAGKIGIRLGADESAVDDLASVAAHVKGSIETQLQARLARALMAMIRGDVRKADASARAGMRILDDHQAAIGATDVRLGIERHAVELGDLGLWLAIHAGIPRRVFRWMERRRGKGLSYRPVAPPRDSALAARLTELRQVTTELRTASAEEVGRLTSRQRRIQESIRDRIRQGRGLGEMADGLDLGSLPESLRNRSLVEFAALDGTLIAVVVKSGRFRLVVVGQENPIRLELESLRFSMRRLARGRAAAATSEEIAKRLDQLLLEPLGLPDNALVVIPTPALHSAPWWVLPSCKERPITICPSAELWVRAKQREFHGESVALIAGPDLQMSDAEIDAISDLYRHPRVIQASESKVDTVQMSFDGAQLAHVASHASFQYENPMFSSLRLSDGDLYVYDIERLSTAPGVVVLSACDSGFSESHPGEELMGLSSALLSMGTRSIIASVGLVPDSEATKDLMVELHRGLAAGKSPSVALHEAQQLAADTPEGYVAAASFICIGAG